MYFETFSEFKRILGHIDSWLEAATVYARSKSFDPNVLVSARLAPDQFALVRQVQSACDAAKFAAVRITGKEAPKHPDTEQTIDELRGRLRSVLEFLNGLTAKDFESAATHVVTNPRWEGKVMSGADYFVEYGIPNFFFHAVHVYAILRHNGVPLGKNDYLGKLSLRDPSA